MQSRFLFYLRIFLLKDYQLLPHVSFKIYSKQSLISDPSGNSNSSFHVGVDIVNLLFLYDFFIFFHL